MIQNMIHPINHLPPVIRIGIQAESGVEVIGFDLAPWLTRWPDMDVSVWPTRPGEEASYLAADTELVGNVFYWYPNGADTEKEGAGTVEVVGVSGGKRKSSGVIDTLVKKTSIDVTQETPDPMKPWVDKVLEAAKEVKSQVDVGTGTGLYLVNQRKDDQGKADRTAEDIKAAVSAGKTVLLRAVSGELYSLCVNLGPNLYFTNVRPGLPGNLNGYGLTVKTAMMTEGDGIQIRIPANGTLSPNPYKLKLTGAVEAEYDGSEEIEVKIPQGGGAEDSMTLVLKKAQLQQSYSNPQEFVLLDKLAKEIIPGSTYKVVYNGVPYTTKARQMDAQFVYIGNIAIVDPSQPETWEPFFFARTPSTNPDDAQALVIVRDGAETVTMEIYEIATTTGGMPDMTGWTGTAYMRYNGAAWEAITIDQLKADLGLTGGETTTEDVFYTADGQVFTDINGAVLHVQKGEA